MFRTSCYVSPLKVIGNVVIHHISVVSGEAIEQQTINIAGQK